MKTKKTAQTPLFEIYRPITHHWTWEVTYKVRSSGYVDRCHVTATGAGKKDLLVGTAHCPVELGDDLREVIEFLAVEAMFAACERTPDGSVPSRSVAFTAHL